MTMLGEIRRLFLGAIAFVLVVGWVPYVLIGHSPGGGSGRAGRALHALATMEHALIAKLGAVGYGAGLLAAGVLIALICCVTYGLRFLDLPDEA